MKRFICMLLFFQFICISTWAFDSDAEIDALQLQPDYLQQMVRRVDSSCRTNFADGEARDYANLQSLSYKRRNCFSLGDVPIDSLRECAEVDYTCVKPLLRDLQDEFVVFKNELKAELALRVAREARALERLNIESDLKDPVKRVDVTVEDLKRVLFEDK